MKKLTDGEARIVLSLLKEDEKSYYGLAKRTGLSREGTGKIVRRLADRGIVKLNPENPHRKFSLNKKRIQIKRFYYVKSSEKKSSFRILQELILPSFLGLVLTILVAFAFLEYAMIFAMGGFIVFISQFLYSFYRISKAEERIEVYST